MKKSKRKNPRLKTRPLPGTLSLKIPAVRPVPFLRNEERMALSLVMVLILLALTVSWWGQGHQFFRTVSRPHYKLGWVLPGARVVWGYSAGDYKTGRASAAPVLGRAATGGVLTVHGKIYPNGIGTYTHSRLLIDVAPGINEITGWCGIPAPALSEQGAYARFRVYLDDKLLFQSFNMGPTDDPIPFRLNVTGTHEVLLRVDPAPGNPGGQAAWLNLEFSKEGS